MNYDSNNIKNRILTATIALGFSLAANAETFLIEPDNYPSRTMINHIIPQVTLSQAFVNNTALQFNVVSAVPDSPVGYPHVLTGNLEIGGNPYWNNNTRLRMDFASSVQSVSLRFGGGDLNANDTGILEAFNSSGTLIASATSSPLPAGSWETLSVSLAGDQIAWAVAYFPANGGSFGRLDHLEFSTVPEPSVCALLVTALGVLCHHQYARRRS